jgi:hypothetical protein
MIQTLARHTDSLPCCRVKAGPDRLERPGCVLARAAKLLGPLVLLAPTRRELVSAPGGPWWEVRVLHAKLYPAKARRA